MQFTFCWSDRTGEKPIDLKLEAHVRQGAAHGARGSDGRGAVRRAPLYGRARPNRYIEKAKVLQMEAVAARKDWLTNKVDRSVTGKVAIGSRPPERYKPPAERLRRRRARLSGYCTASPRRSGHAVGVAMAGSAQGTADAPPSPEALTDTVFAPIDGGLRSVSLSANWMWPWKNEGEDARLYAAVPGGQRLCGGGPRNQTAPTGQGFAVDDAEVRAPTESSSTRRERSSSLRRPRSRTSRRRFLRP